MQQFQLAMLPLKPHGKAPGRRASTVLPLKPRQPVLKRRLAVA